MTRGKGSGTENIAPCEKCKILVSSLRLERSGQTKSWLMQQSSPRQLVYFPTVFGKQHHVCEPILDISQPHSREFPIGSLLKEDLSAHRDQELELVVG
jgi:hypothetical protein